MTLAYHVANVVSILLFLFYGFLCLNSKGMIEDFDRFGLPQWRRPTGILEILGALGLAGGYALPILVAPSAIGLATLMLMAIAVRARERDSLAEMLPAAFLLLSNAFIASQAILT